MEDKSKWVVTFSRHELNPETWTVMSEKPKNFAKLIISDDGYKRKFAGVTWRSRDKEMDKVDIAETMAMQGSFWCMPKKLWDDEIGRLQTEGYGPLYQDSVEMMFKIWRAGGKLILNKKGWYAHKHRSFKRTHNINGDESQKSFDYSISVWNDYYESTIRPRFGI